MSYRFKLPQIWMAIMWGIVSKIHFTPLKWRQIIVSGSTIPLDEDDEREALNTVIKRNQTSLKKTEEDRDTNIISRTAGELLSLTSGDHSLSALFGTKPSLCAIFC